MRPVAAPRAFNKAWSHSPTKEAEHALDPGRHVACGARHHQGHPELHEYPRQTEQLGRIHRQHITKELRADVAFGGEGLAYAGVESDPAVERRYLYIHGKVAQIDA